MWQGTEGQQLQALTALQGLARGSKQWSTVSFAAVQAAFREAAGFPLLVNLIATARSPRSACHCWLDAPAFSVRAFSFGVPCGSGLLEWPTVVATTS